MRDKSPTRSTMSADLLAGLTAAIPSIPGAMASGVLAGVSPLGDMFAGMPAAYATFVGYDEVAHHSGIESEDAFDVLRKLDRQLARLESAARQVPHPYHLVLLSDHGHSGGATFKQRYSLSLEEFVQQLATDKSSWRYERASLEQIEAAYPGLLDGLAQHRGIGFVLATPGPAGHQPVGGLVFGPGAGAVVGRCFHPDVSHHAARPGSLARRVVRRADRRPDLGSGQNGLCLVREPLCHLQNVIYGSVGAIIAFFLWSCLSAQIFLLGAEFTAEHSRWRRAGRPVETQPLHEWLADWSPVREIEEGT
jgi:hypothetical protein